MHLVCLVLSNTDVARVEVMLNMRLGHSVRPQPYKKINDTCANSTTYALSTSFNEPLYRFTSKSMMLGCPSRAALKTCQAPLQETQHTENNKGKSGRECTENTSPQIISTNMAAVVQGPCPLSSFTLSRSFSLYAASKKAYCRPCTVDTMLPHRNADRTHYN